MQTVENSTIEQSQNQVENQERDDGDELEYVRTEAQKKIDGYLTDPNTIFEEKMILLNHRIETQDRLLEKYADHERFASSKQSSLLIKDLLNQAKENLTAQNRLSETINTPEEMDTNTTENEVTAPAEDQTKPQDEADEELKQPEGNQERIDQITELIKKNNNAADEIARMLYSIKSTIENSSPRDVSFAALNDFNDKRIIGLTTRVINMIKQEELETASQLFLKNDPRAESYFQQATDHLSNQWHLIDKEIDSAGDAAIKYRQRLENEFDREIDEHGALATTIRNLRQAKEIYQNEARNIIRY